MAEREERKAAGTLGTQPPNLLLEVSIGHLLDPGLVGACPPFQDSGKPGLPMPEVSYS